LEGEGIYIEKRENRFADMEKGKQKRQIGRDKEVKQKCPRNFFGRFSPLLESRREETTWTTRDNLFKGAGWSTPPGGSCEWDAGGEKKINRTKGDKVVGGERAGFQPQRTKGERKEREGGHGSLGNRCANIEKGRERP
jgi:hypothetical protein